MAGETALPIQECPDLIAHTVTTTVPDTAFDNTAYDGAFLFYCERDTVVDAAHFICSVTDASGKVTLNTGSTGLPGAGSAISSLLTPGTAGTPQAFTLTETANLIPAGNWIAVEVANDGDTADVVGAMVQLRLRTRVR